MSDRVAIVGSRPEDSVIERGRILEIGPLDRARRNAIFEYVAALHDGTIVVHGDCIGADLWADEAARVCGLQRIRIPAPWRRRNGTIDRGAGRRRNAIIEAESTRAAVFYGSSGRSDGAGHTFDLFREAGKPVEAIEWR